MIPISRCSAQTSVPAWFVGASAGDNDVSKAAAITENMDESQLVAEKAKIERCVEQGEQYYYSDSLDTQAISELKEYAAVCDMPVNDIIEVSAAQKKEYAALSALIEKPEEQAPADLEKRDLDGPFSVDSTPDSVFEDSREWETVTPSHKISAETPMDGSIRSLRGGERDDVVQVVGVKPGQNSVVAPNAIGEMVAAESKGSKQTILEQNQQRKEDISFDKGGWEAEVIASMEHKSIAAMPRGSFRVESLGSQRHTPNVGVGQHSIGGIVECPDKTPGERLAELNNDRKQSIQRESGEDKNWDSSESAIKSSVSDTFAESLKAKLKAQR